MTHKIEKPNGTQITITARTPYAELEPLLPKAAAKISEEIEIEGFRKGKAPYEVVKQRVGEFKILEEAARMYIYTNAENIIREALEKEFRGKSFDPHTHRGDSRAPNGRFTSMSVGVEPVGEPQVAITKLAPGEELEFKITLSLLPAIELPDYKVIAKRVLATQRIPEITEKEVTDALEWLRESRAKLVTVNRPAARGDRVEIDFKTSQDGVTLQDGASENHPVILGQGKLLPGFEDQLLGMSAGEEKMFTLAIPLDYYRKSIAGKALTITATMKLVQERTVPEWNDEFARSLGEFSGTAAVVESIRQGLAIEKEASERERVRMAMIEAIAQESNAEIPEPLLANELTRMVSELRHSIEDMGLKFEDYLTHLKKGEADLTREWRPDAERRVKIALVLREIARREEIAPGDEEVAELANRTAEREGLSSEKLPSLDRKALFDYHRSIARNEKVFRFLEGLSSAA